MLHSLTILATWLFLGACLFSQSVLGQAALRVSPLAGVMQQPTSNYYLLIYGASADVIFGAESFFIRGIWFERPLFRSHGFEDQEYGFFGLFGTSVAQWGRYRLVGLAGGGKVSGYVRAITPFEDEPESRYESLGIDLGLDGQASFGSFDLRMGHQTHIGLGEPGEVMGFVVWPFNFFYAQVSYVFGRS